MKVVPKGTGEAAIYTCPMHPEIREAAPGTCPKHGMALERVAPAALWLGFGGGQCLSLADYVTGPDAHARERPPPDVLVLRTLADYVTGWAPKHKATVTEGAWRGLMLGRSLNGKFVTVQKVPVKEAPCARG